MTLELCTCVERLQLIGRLLRIQHALQKWFNASVILSPEIIGKAQCHGRAI